MELLLGLFQLHGRAAREMRRGARSAATAHATRARDLPVTAFPAAAGKAAAVDSQGGTEGRKCGN